MSDDYQVGDTVRLVAITMGDAGDNLTERIGKTATVVVVPQHHYGAGTVIVRFADMDTNMLVYLDEIEKVAA